MRVIQLLLVTIHILAAALWLGAMGFLGLILVPELRRLEKALRLELLVATGRRLRNIAWFLFFVLSTTGLLQLWLRGYRPPDLSGPLWQGPAGAALTWKLGLFAAAICLAAWHDFFAGPRAVTSPVADGDAERWRRLASAAGRVLFLLGLAIVYCAVAFVRGGFL
ncbi:MAG: CopD family protein [Thermoanaerobaculia bacterium]